MRPFVERDAAGHALDAVVADDGDPGVIGDVFENLPQRGIYMCIVIFHACRQLRVGFVARMFLVEVFPEAVVNAVGAHLDHHEKIPGLVLQQPLGVSGVVVGHLEDAFEQTNFVVGAEVFYVGNVRPGTLAPARVSTVAG